MKGIPFVSRGLARNKINKKIECTIKEIEDNTVRLETDIKNYTDPQNTSLITAMKNKDIMIEAVNSLVVKSISDCLSAIGYNNFNGTDSLKLRKLRFALEEYKSFSDTLREYSTDEFDEIKKKLIEYIEVSQTFEKSILNRSTYTIALVVAFTTISQIVIAINSKEKVYQLVKLDSNSKVVDIDYNVVCSDHIKEKAMLNNIIISKNLLNKNQATKMYFEIDKNKKLTKELEICRTKNQVDHSTKEET